MTGNNEKNPLPQSLPAIPSNSLHSQLIKQYHSGNHRPQPFHVELIALFFLCRVITGNKPIAPTRQNGDGQQDHHQGKNR